MVDAERVAGTGAGRRWLAVAALNAVTVALMLLPPAVAVLGLLGLLS